ncbi:MAG TPA: hypothetical protein VGK74_18290 [Symbiobacteriaceae bacterium]|jgi:hypothetical protein
MKKQTVMWTALPGGISGSGETKRLILSVFVSPRLQTDEGLPRPELAQFPDFLNWPAAAPTSFTVQFNGGPARPATVVSTAVPALWTALFKPSTYVRPYVFPKLDDRFIRSFPAAHVLSFIKQQYQQAAIRNPTEFPFVESLSSRKGFGMIGGYNTRPNLSFVGDGNGADFALQAELDKTMEAYGAIPPSPTPNPRADFYQAKLFYQPRNQTRQAVTLPDLDFHQIVSSLGDYPMIMRLVGLVIDLELDLDETIPAAGAVSVTPGWNPQTAATTNLSPKTVYTLTASTFMAAARPTDPELAGGLLKLDDKDRYQVVQVDLDGAANQAMNFADHLLRMVATNRGNGRASLPAMRSGGLQLMKTGHAYRTAQSLDQATQRNTDAEGGTPPTLYAEDVTRGYRVDVWDDQTGKWHSLCRRTGTYRFTDGGPTATVEEEGFITMGMTSSSDESSTDLYLHESLVRWGGWSLVAARPGRIIDPKDAVAPNNNPAATDFKLETSFAATPRTLPRLRFGVTYRMRARAVDLAGGGLPLEANADLPDDAGATAPAPFVRFEPVPTPTVVRREDLTPGEALERMVIRSNFDKPSAKVNERHVAPPLGAQLTAEQHGLFDVAGGLDKAAYNTIKSREGSLAEVQPEESLALPYLPDPIARGAALAGLPGMAPGAVRQVGFSGTWPGNAPFRVRIDEGAGAPDWDAGARVLTVHLPKAEIAHVKLSSYLGADDLKRMGVWKWIEEANLSPAATAPIKQAALQGRHWMISPNRELTLVHAVQQPLLAPEYQKPQAQKNLGETFATLVDHMPISGKSTARVDVAAAWAEPVDILSEPGPRTATGTANPFHVDVDYGDTVADIQKQHEFGDTKYRKVNYTAVATTRFSEYFHVPASETLTLAGEAASSVAGAPVADHTETITSGDGSVTYARGVDYAIDYPAGSVRRLAGSAIPDGGTVKVAYAHYPGPITRETAAPVAVDVYNSARPAAPKVLYVVPTFGWEHKDFDEGDGVIINRTGGGLRVYLDRPWYSAGDGELLGAVLWSGPGKLVLLKNPPTRPPDVLKPYVSQWGLDPIWASTAPRPTPLPEHFTRAVATGTGLTLEEVPGQTVTVAGHAVHYDAVRKLWYCDIDIDAGHSYYPFVRLALARYQPKSVPNAHLSRVVLADFAQLAPDRLATIMTDAAHPKELTVNVCGPGYRLSGATRTPSEMEVSVEQKRDGVAGDLGWIPVPGATFPLAVRDVDHPDMTWSGQATLPEARGAKPFRLVIREYERFESDGSPQGFVVGFARINPTQRRLVYAAVLEI